MIYVLSVNAQVNENTGTCTGNIKSKQGEPIIGATVQIESLKKGVLSDLNGNYKLSEIPPGTYTILIKYIGYHDLVETATITAGENIFLNIKLDEKTHEMTDVIIHGKTETQRLKEEPIKVEVIDTKQAQQESATLTELMTRASGVIVRQTGGLGSSTNIMINGFQGKAIKNFKDGIPIDYMGNGYDISLVPVNMIERVEVYKGVLPTKLGADALGGAVNLVSKTGLRNYIDVAYEIASFNTHRASVNTYFKDTTRKLFAGADVFFNHSDNSYKVLAKALDPVTRTRTDAEVTRFHDGINNYYTEAYGGVSGSKWADMLRIGVTFFRLDKQEQNGALMTEAYGQVTSSQYSVFPTIRYKKTLFREKFEIDQFLVYNTIHSQRVDTCHCTYDWYGKKTPSTSRLGESEQDGALPKIDLTNFTSRTYLSYRINANHRLELNNVYSGFGRIGSDPFGPRYNFSGRDVLSVPAGYQKLVASLGLESMLFNKHITHVIIGKYYHYQTNGTDAAYTSYDENQVISSGDQFGIADAVKFNFTTNTFLRASVEYATRLPEQSEVFGDGIFVLSNFNLKPEQSINFNLGFRTQKFGKYSLEINSFYRITKGLIIQIPIFIPFSQFNNVEQVKGFGGEIDGNINVFKWLVINGNVTYQDLRLFDIEEVNNRFLEGARLRNTPYFFGNLGLRAAFNNVFLNNTKLQAYSYYTHIHEYYLESIPQDKEAEGFWGEAQINSDLIIPSQNLFTGGVNYSVMKERLSFGFEVKNILNANLYDNFRVQKAGRSFHFKLRYVLR